MNNDIQNLIDMANDVYRLYGETSDPNIRMELKKCEADLRKCFIRMSVFLDWNNNDLECDEENLSTLITNRIARDQRYLRQRAGLESYELA